MIDMTMNRKKLDVTCVGAFIVIKNGGYDYDIAKDRIDTKEKLLSWVEHLLEKTWFDKHCGIELIRFVHDLNRWTHLDP